MISVWGVPELSGKATVRPDGKITLPAAGEIIASGDSPSNLSKKLTDVLQNFIKKPIVTVTVDQITNNKVYVAGDGVTTGVFNLPGRTTLFKFLCSLGSLEKADLRNAYLIRDGEKQEVDFYDLFFGGDLSRDIGLKSEDILFIPSNERNKVYVVGAVKTPQFLIFRDGMKVLDAILEAGGFDEYADKNDVTIFRKGGEKIHIRAKDIIKGKDMGYNVPLKPGDYVAVEESLFF
jgi:polysaccharide export outer membrane protein